MTFLIELAACFRAAMSSSIASKLAAARERRLNESTASSKSRSADMFVIFCLRSRILSSVDLNYFNLKTKKMKLINWTSNDRKSKAIFISEWLHAACDFEVRDSHSPIDLYDFFIIIISRNFKSTSSSKSSIAAPTELFGTRAPRTSKNASSVMTFSARFLAALNGSSKSGELFACSGAGLK